MFPSAARSECFQRRCFDPPCGICMWHLLLSVDVVCYSRRGERRTYFRTYFLIHSRRRCPFNRARGIVLFRRALVLSDTDSMWTCLLNILTPTRVTHRERKAQALAALRAFSLPASQQRCAHTSDTRDGRFRFMWINLMALLNDIVKHAKRNASGESLQGKRKTPQFLVYSV